MVLVIRRAADARQLLASWPLGSFLFVGSVTELTLQLSAELRWRRSAT
jgi:hypothetical protein